MATVTKSWLETTCPKCEARRLFHINDGWVLVCSVCGERKPLDKTGIVAV